MKVLIAIDESDCSKQLISEVANRAWSSDTKFLVLNVVSMPVPEFWHDAFDKDIETLAQATHLTTWAVNELKKNLGPRVSVERSFAEGYVVESIIQVASDWCADLVMLGSHGRQGVSRLLLGSVAESVLMRVGCSVEIVKSRKLMQTCVPESRASALPR